MDDRNFIPSENVSHVEIAMVTYDQWVLTIAVRSYEKGSGSVIGMTHVIFEEVEGFRLLDEGAMLQFPWGDIRKSKSFVQVVSKGGWYDLEKSKGNMQLPETAQEYVIVTDNECVSVIAYTEPKVANS